MITLSRNLASQSQTAGPIDTINPPANPGNASWNCKYDSRNTSDSTTKSKVSQPYSEDSVWPHPINTSNLAAKANWWLQKANKRRGKESEKREKCNKFRVCKIKQVSSTATSNPLSNSQALMNNLLPLMPRKEANLALNLPFPTSTPRQKRRKNPSSLANPSDADSITASNHPKFSKN